MSERQATPRPKAGRSNDRRDGSDSRTRSGSETDGDADGSGASGGSQVSSEQRAREMYRLRIEEQLTLQEIGQRFGIGAERTRQILKRHCHTNKITYPSQVKHRSR
jgi:Sigma-70, region 4